METPDAIRHSEPALSPDEQQRGMRHAILASCFGAIPQVLLKDSSVFILFATTLGASETFSVFTTASVDLAILFFLLPFAYLSEFLGKKRLMLWCCGLSLVTMLLCAAAPWFGAQARHVLMAGVIGFALAITPQVAAWFPILDGIVPAESRGRFFSRLRVSWQTVTVVFLAASAWWIGKAATVQTLQTVVALSGLVLAGKLWHLARVPEVRLPKPVGVKPVLLDILGNGPLTGFAVYILCLYAAAGSTVPVVFLFAKRFLELPDNAVVMLSAWLMVGTIAGYGSTGFFVDRHGTKPVFLTAHLGFGLVNVLLFLTGADVTGVASLGPLILAYGFLFAGASIAVTTEMLHLAPENNKAMSIAFCFVAYSGGTALSRVGTSLLLGSGIFSPSWSVLGRTMTQYHSLFLFYAATVILATALLVLVPAVIKGVRRLPGL
jgi:MFS family permease